MYYNSNAIIPDSLEKNVELYKTNLEQWTDKKIIKYMEKGLWLNGIPHGKNVCA